MKVTIICNEDNNLLRQIKNTVFVLNGVQNYYYFELVTTELDDIKNIEIPLDWNSFRTKHINEIGNNIYITERAFSDNWFSHEERNYSVITISDWEESFSPPSLQCYLIYQIAQASINFAADINEDMEMRMVHMNSEGCLFDMCMHKSDIKLGMLAGSICPNCKGTLMRYGIDEKAINSAQKMISYVRSKSLGTANLVDYNGAFIVMRFSENDENDNAYRYGIVAALEKLGITPRRADDVIQSQQILNQVTNYIRNSRFVIIKVDTNNLNVYFELGLAMGLDKDILLISENDEIHNLPVDLNNFECLTYHKGNYEELKNKVMSFFKDNYHY